MKRYSRGEIDANGRITPKGAKAAKRRANAIGATVAVGTAAIYGIALKSIVDASREEQAGFQFFQDYAEHLNRNTENFYRSFASKGYDFVSTATGGIRSTSTGKVTTGGYKDLGRTNEGLVPRN